MKKSSKKHKKALSELEEIPELLPLFGSENVQEELMTFDRSTFEIDDEGSYEDNEQESDCNHPEKCGDSGCCRNEEGEEIYESASPLEWRLTLSLSKPRSEAQLANGFSSLIDAQRKDFPSTIYFVGLCANNKNYDELPLFVGEVEKLQRKINTTINSKRKRDKLSAKQPSKPFRFQFSALCIFVHIIGSKDKGEAELLEENDLKYLKDKVLECLDTFDKDAQLQAEEAFEAAARAQKIAEMIEFGDRTLGIILSSKEGFKGRDLWDVLLCLGFRYMPSEKGYAFGEEEIWYLHVAAISSPIDPLVLSRSDSVVHDIQFNLFAPLCENPMDVLRCMINAAKYAQKRLGGDLFHFQQPFVENELESEVLAIVSKMKECGIPPGSSYCEQLW
eukprot:TRINITY_DN11772_c0_g2_i1.p1 TRINITY_DN11772_c0_g2~~TRINITY_DN11772_c0_g2_i1.p1  ORF type:complete len:390 (-),score=60.38 TRINITY_DN11772_c0_g2_i1:69-1238(-)